MASSNSKRIAKNTLMLYFRQILILFVSLYTVRVVLNVLGTEDYGIYNVVAGVVTMFSFLSNSMATASQRYFSYDLGKKDIKHLSVTYCVTIQIYVVLSVIVILLAETFGLWFINTKLIIPENRLFAANCIFQAAIISFIFTLNTSPYMACIIAHEDMKIYAYVSVVETILKLLLVYLLKILFFDKLITYGILLSIVSVIITSIYRIYCKKHYTECKFLLIYDKDLFKEIITYSGWNLFGASVSVVNNQIMNIQLNLFFGPIVNAARGIASQVNSAVNSFAQNFSTAMRPQIIKSYAQNNNNEIAELVYKGSKLTYFLLLMLTMPLILELDFVLKLWLKHPPEFASIFTRIALVNSLIECIFFQIMTLAQATGKIKLYQSVVGGILLLSLPISYVVFKLGAPPYGVSLVNTFLTIIAGVARLIIVKKLTDFSISKFIAKVICPCLVVTILASIIPVFVHFYMKQTFGRLCCCTFCSILTILFWALFIGFNKNEKKEMLNVIKTRIGRKL